MPGHLASACQNKGKIGTTRNFNRFNNRPPTSANNYMPNEVEEEIYLIHNVQERTKSYLTDIKVNGKTIFEIDTGARVSIISEETHNNLFKVTKLMPTHAKIKTNSNKPLCILGMLKVDVAIKNKIHIIKDPDLIYLDVTGYVYFKSTKEWQFSAILPQNTQKKLHEILAAHNSLFTNKIGRMKGYQAKIHVKNDVIPKFVKAQPVLFSPEETVTEELDRLEKAGILISIPFSEWACPIVIIPKPDGSVRVCDNFKRSVNPNTETQTYPTPSNDEIISKIQRGQRKWTYGKRTHKGPKQYETIPYCFAGDFMIYTESSITRSHLIQSNLQTMDDPTLFNSDHRIILSCTKSVRVLFERRKSNRLKPQGVTYNGQVTPSSSSVKFLGITFDSALTFRSHFHTVATLTCHRLYLYPHPPPTSVHCLITVHQLHA